MYQWAMAKLLPTSRKSHYTFNLRDFSKVIRGICNANHKFLNTKEQFYRLWVNEIFRVFGDRLVDNEDSLLELNECREKIKSTFGGSFDTIFNYIDIDKDGKIVTVNEMNK